ncbi:histidine phosphatase family protein [Tropicimonas marinistellae]|uniref:histidine phosphatase family protein n=1 Tax=Tropicimonas marinistellae TaxID=1739787 RepID=UPI000830F204|nr:histidine phosphatase family protein [Tropicimonas marinistellae]
MSPRYAALVRHGAYHQRAGAPSALQPFPLTDEGEEQARACGDELAAHIARDGLDLDPVVHCSCQLRAWQTATLACETLGRHGLRIAEIRQSPALAERGLGSAANLTLAEIEAVLAADPRFAPPPPGWKSDNYYRLPLQGAESMEDAGKRVAAYLRQTIGRPSPNENPRLTLYFGHGAAFRHAAHQLGVLTLDAVADLSMFHARPLHLCYMADGTWSHYGGDWKQRARGRTGLD